MPEIRPDTRLTVSGSKGVANLARLCDVEPAEAAAALANMIMPGATGAEMIAFAAVCATHRLDPLKKEIYAFKSKFTGLWSAGLYIDGWLTIIHRHPDYGGMEISYVENEQTKKPHSCTVRIIRKSGLVTPPITEYYDECRMATDPWSKWPHRLLRHRAIIQSARVALGFGDIVDAAEWDDYARGDAGLAKRSHQAGAAVLELNQMLEPGGPEPEPASEVPPAATEAAPAAPEPKAAPKPARRRPAPRAAPPASEEPAADPRPMPDVPIRHTKDAIPLSDSDLDDMLS